jgi:hypothetical protein
MSGPVFSDIEQGCEYPADPNVTVCSGNPAICAPGGHQQNTWTQAPQYSPVNLPGTRYATGDGNCYNPPSTTSSGENTRWFNMSVLGGTPSFSYPKTYFSSFLCSSVNIPTGQSCDTNDPQNCMNNSSPQGWLFDQNVTAKGNYYLYSVGTCDGPEGVQGPDAFVSAYSEGGMAAIEDDMTGGRNASLTGVCANNH